MREYFGLALNVILQPDVVRNLYHNRRVSVSDLIFTYDDLVYWLTKYPSVMIRDMCSDGDIYENISFCMYFTWSARVDIYINRKQFNVKNATGDNR